MIGCATLILGIILGSIRFALSLLVVVWNGTLWLVRLELGKAGALFPLLFGPIKTSKEPGSKNISWPPLNWMEVTSQEKGLPASCVCSSFKLVASPPRPAYWMRGSMARSCFTIERPAAKGEGTATPSLAFQ